MFHDVLDNPNNHNITHTQKTQGDLSLKNRLWGGGVFKKKITLLL